MDRPLAFLKNKLSPRKVARKPAGFYSENRQKQNIKFNRPVSSPVSLPSPPAEATGQPVTCVNMASDESTCLLSSMTKESDRGNAMSVPNALMPERFSGTGDPDMWFARFKRFAELQKWSDDQMCAVFPLLLSDRAQEWVATLTEDTLADFEALERVFLARFRPGPSDKWRLLTEFQSRKQRPNESVDDYCQHIVQIGHKLERSEKDIVQTLIAGLHPRVAAYLKFAAPSSLDETVQGAKMASVFHDSDGSEPLSTVQSSLSALTHKISELQAQISVLNSQPPNLPNAQSRHDWRPIPSRNQSSTGAGPRQSEAPKSFSSPSRPSHSSSCLSCGGSHDRSRCRFFRATCHYCGKVGHIQSVCRSKQKRL